MNPNGSQWMMTKRHHREAFAEHYQDLHHFVLRRSPNSDSHAIVADAFLIAWNKWASRPSRPEEVRPWMFGITHNTLRNSQRRESRRPHLEAQHAYDLSQTTEADPSNVQIRAALATLSPADQAVLQLTAWEGFSTRELAVALANNERAVRVRLHRARRRLASALIGLGAKPCVNVAAHSVSIPTEGVSP
jgi:RNA polymerase sigma-70 factor, ECF subfamily